MGRLEGVLTITSPANGDTLGLQFSAFGLCDAIGPNNNPTLTATLEDGNGNLIQSVTTINNPEKHSWEAVFSLPFDPSIINAGKIKVTCPEMPDAKVHCLTVTNQEAVITVALPIAAEQFPPGDAAGMGTLASGYNLQHYVTQAGHQLGSLPASPLSAGIPSHIFTVPLGSLPAGSNYVLHLHVLEQNGTKEVRASSPFFNVSSSGVVTRGKR